MKYFWESTLLLTWLIVSSKTGDNHLLRRIQYSTLHFIKKSTIGMDRIIISLFSRTVCVTVTIISEHFYQFFNRKTSIIFWPISVLKLSPKIKILLSLFLVFLYNAKNSHQEFHSHIHVLLAWNLYQAFSDTPKFFIITNFNTYILILG